MNHGYCKNCWWWYYEGAIHPASISKEYRSVWESINDKPFPVCWGKCYFSIPFLETKEDSYCPDYIRRKKEEKKSGTLEDWINNKL